MRKVKLSKMELKHWKDRLRRYNRYLPALYIKKRRLSRELIRIDGQLHELELDYGHRRQQIDQWIGLAATYGELMQHIAVEGIELENENIAGVNLELCNGIRFKRPLYDLLLTPLWVDNAVVALQSIYRIGIEQAFLSRQRELVSEELRITIQRVNMFEKIKIPEAVEAIRKIRVFLGDQQTAAIGWSRIARKKITARAKRVASANR